jgi:hypothetical protein
MNDYSSGDLMAAILTLQEATAAGFTRLEAKIDSKADAVVMNRRFDRIDERFDRMDERFDRLERRLETIEPPLR